MRVVVSGYYGFGNLGDEALLEGLLGALTGRGFEPVVLSSDPAASRELHGVRAAHRLWGVVGALGGAAALVSGGGGLLQDRTSARSLGYYLGVIRLARLLGRRVVVYGQSLGPLSSGGRVRVGRALAGVPLALRDELSVELARELGLSAVLVGDPALLLGEGGRLAPRGPAPAGAPVVLVPRGGQDELNGVLVRLAVELEAAGVPLAGMAFYPAEDGGPLAELLGRVPSMRVWEGSSAGEAVGFLRGARFVVSVRLHGLILAAAAGVGFAGLSYDPKVDGFGSEAGARVFHSPVDVGELFSLVVESAPPDAVRLERLGVVARSGAEWLGGALRAGG